MATVFEDRGYRFYFYAVDLNEPIYVHIARSGREAKFWIQPIHVAFNGAYKNHELNEIERIINERYDEIIAVWNREKDKRDNN